MTRLFIVDVLVLFCWTLCAAVYGRTCNTFEHNESHVCAPCLIICVAMLCLAYTAWFYGCVVVFSEERNVKFLGNFYALSGGGYVTIQGIAP